MSHLFDWTPAHARRPQTPDELLEDLTDPQRAAVTHRGGPLLVVAGAGSGKTRVLTRRIAHLLATGDVRPHEVLAITFTNKAADEMRRRVVELVGADAQRMWVATFHSACLRILRATADRLGYAPGFTIYDTRDVLDVVERIERELGYDTKRLSPRAVAAAISAAKNAGLDAGRYADQRHDEPLARRVGEVFARYQAALRTANAMDFDDLLGNALTVLTREDDLRDHYQQRFAQVLVDEFQDTNGVQDDLVSLLAMRHRQLSVVGDADQSIYRFRAADVRNILTFAERFPDARVVVLEQNFRSTQTILDAANAVIERNPGRPAKRLFTRGARGARVRLYRAGDEYEEARFVAEELRRLRTEHAIAYHDMAVFYRTNAQSRVLEEELLHAGVPYRVIAGLRFYDRAEVKTALAYARLVVNPRDEASARRVINEPRRGIGAAAQARLAGWAAENGRSFAEAPWHAAEAGLGARALTGARDFAALLDELRARDPSDPRGLIEAIVERSGMTAALASLEPREAEARLENLGALASAAAEYESVGDFIERVSLVADADQLDPASGTVSLMTLHVAKGLEFAAVVITGLEEAVFPHRRALADPDELEEERRLCYVGLTRAKAHLTLTHAWARTQWGQRADALPSRFLGEMPAALVEDISRAAPMRWREATRENRPARSDLGTATFGGDDVPGGRVFGSGTAPAARSTGAELLGLAPGDRVVHERYGAGTVVRCGGAGMQARATVSFDNAGTKQLVLAMTPLRRAEPEG